LSSSVPDYSAEVVAAIEDKFDDLADRFDIDDRSSREGAVTRKLEHFSAALPSTTWLMLAGGSMIGSLALEFFGRHRAAKFAADLVPTFLLVGIYNKLVKIAGSDRQVAY